LRFCASTANVQPRFCGFIGHISCLLGLLDPKMCSESVWFKGLEYAAPNSCGFLSPLVAQGSHALTNATTCAGHEVH
jgi:hypothetical protein